MYTYQPKEMPVLRFTICVLIDVIHRETSGILMFLLTRVYRMMDSGRFIKMPTLSGMLCTDQNKERKDHFQNRYEIFFYFTLSCLVLILNIVSAISSLGPIIIC